MQQAIRLNGLEAKLFAWTQNRGVHLIRSGDLVKALGFTKRQEEALLYYLGKRQRIAKVQRGLYLVPRNIPLGGKWKPSPLVIVPVLMNELKTKNWQITGAMAFQRYGLSSQMPSRIDVYNDKLSAVRNILGQEYRFMKVNKQRLGNTIDFEIKEREGSYSISMSSEARTIFDAIYDYERFGVLEDAFDWLKMRIKNPKFMKEFVEILLPFGNVAVKRRVGYILDSLKVDAKWIKKIQTTLKPTKGVIPLVPSKGRKGRVDLKWGVIIYEG